MVISAVRKSDLVNIIVLVGIQWNSCSQILLLTFLIHIPLEKPFGDIHEGPWKYLCTFSVLSPEEHFKIIKNVAKFMQVNLLISSFCIMWKIYNSKKMIKVFDFSFNSSVYYGIYITLKSHQASLTSCSLYEENSLFSSAFAKTSPF